MTISAITSDPETSSKKSNDGIACTTGIEFRKSLGINEAEVSFPSTGDAAQSKRKSSGRRSSKSKYRLGYGLRVPLFALAFPISDPVETAAEALTEQDHVITKKSTIIRLHVMASQALIHSNHIRKGGNHPGTVRPR